MNITSAVIPSGERIPVEYTGDGDDISPPLEWSAVPEATKEFALIVEDPDAPSAKPWVHWVIYKLPAEQRGIPEGVQPVLRPESPPETLQGMNSWNSVGYRGPAPPPKHGAHHYHFKLYALDTAVDLPPEATKEQLLQAIDGHIIETAELVALYER